MSTREHLRSRLGFLLLAAGCAVGLGNVWRFPFIVGANGGGAFVLLYFVCLALLGFPILTVELTLGRGGESGIIGALARLAPPRHSRAWRAAGWMIFLGNLLLMMYYSAVTGWLLYYFARYSLAGLPAETPAAAKAFFASFLAQPSAGLAAMGTGVVFSAAICALGLQRGVERATKWMMLSLFVLLAGLALRALALPGAAAGVAFYLKPNFAELFAHPVEALSAALGQAFFTLSVGVGCMTIFGSYIGRAHALASESVIIIVLDTLVALLSGLIIFPACFSYHVNVGEGPGLIFIALPNVFSHLGGGRFWGAVFFLFLALAALTTLIAVFECLTAGLMEEARLSRGRAAGLVGAAVAVLSIPCVLGFNLWQRFQPLGKGNTILDLEDFLFSQLWLPLGALAMVFFISSSSGGWGWKPFLAEANAGRGLHLSGGLRRYMRFAVPALVLFILVLGIWKKFS